jgi:hypothetical protein
MKKIQRQAILIAAVTMAGVIAIVLSYWQGVSRGVLPSPVQPLVVSKGAVPNKPAIVAARELTAPSSAGASEPIRLAASSAAKPTAPSKRAEPPIQVPNQPAPVAAAPADPASSASSSTNQLPKAPLPELAVKPPAAESPQPTPASQRPSPIAPADEKLAHHWLSSTNERPVLRVHYDPADILRLAESGRGVIVASSQSKVASRELYLQSKADTAPLFAPYTRGVADRFSSYSLLLEASPPLAQLTTAFPVYFPGVAVVLSFVPDMTLATEMFGQVACAMRSRGGEVRVSPQTVFEGQLTLEGTQPRFALLEIRSGATRSPVDP